MKYKERSKYLKKIKKDKYLYNALYHFINFVILTIFEILGRILNRNAKWDVFN